MKTVYSSEPLFEALTNGDEKIERILTLDMKDKFVKAYIQNIAKDNLDKNLYLIRTFQKIYEEGARIAQTNKYTFTSEDLEYVAREILDIKLNLCEERLKNIEEVENYTQDEDSLNHLLGKIINKKATKQDKLTLRINELLSKFKDPNIKYDPKLLDYFDKNYDIIYNHYDILYLSEQEILLKDIEMNGINPKYKSCKYKLVKEMVRLLELRDISDVKKKFSDEEMVNKLTDFIISNFMDIKELFGVESDGFLEKKDYQTCKNVVNKILDYVGMKLKCEYVDRSYNNITNKLNITYDNLFVKKIIYLLK